MKIAHFYNKTKHVDPLSLKVMSMPFDEFPINIIAAAIIIMPDIL
ncbi:hypothetical protein [Clostridium sp.]|jgi:hypothetical protein